MEKKVFILTYINEGETLETKAATSKKPLLEYAETKCKSLGYDDEDVKPVIYGLEHNGSYIDKENYDEWYLVEADMLD